MPMVLVRAADFGLTGYESVAALNADGAQRARLEALRLAAIPDGMPKTLSIEHPGGAFSVELAFAPGDPERVARAALLRTARPIMRGEVLIPGHL